MSRRDIYHQLVKEALIAEGWQITHDPYIFETDPQLATDLGAERVIGATRNNEKIAVEIKSFLAESQVSDLEKALGQYGLYRRLLQIQEPIVFCIWLYQHSLSKTFFKSRLGNLLLTSSSSN